MKTLLKQPTTVRTRRRPTRSNHHHAPPNHHHHATLTHDRHQAQNDTSHHLSQPRKPKADADERTPQPPPTHDSPHDPQLDAPHEPPLEPLAEAHSFRFTLPARAADADVTADGDADTYFVTLASMLRDSFDSPRPPPPSTSWVINHHRWIVWKLARLKRQDHARVDFTLTTLLRCMRRRLTQEVLHKRQSFVRRILDGNAAPSAHAVLCIASIDASQHTVELTDGWYSIHALLDAPLQRQLARGRLPLGLRLRLWGTTFDDKSDVPRLMLHANGVRRVPLATRLGMAPSLGFRVKLNSLVVKGGQAPCVHVRVERAYGPLAFTRSSGRWQTRDEYYASLDARREAQERCPPRDAPQQRDEAHEAPTWKVLLLVSDLDGGATVEAALWFDGDGDGIDDLMIEGCTWKVYGAELVDDHGNGGRALKTRANFWRPFLSSTPPASAHELRARAFTPLAAMSQLALGAECDAVGVLLFAMPAEGTTADAGSYVLFLADASADALLCVKWDFGATESAPPLRVGSVMAVVNGRVDDHSCITDAIDQSRVIHLHLVIAHTTVPHAALILTQTDRRLPHLAQPLDELQRASASLRRRHAELAAYGAPIILGELQARRVGVGEAATVAALPSDPQQQQQQPTRWPQAAANVQSLPQPASEVAGYQPPLPSAEAQPRAPTPGSPTTLANSATSVVLELLRESAANGATMGQLLDRILECESIDARNAADRIQTVLESLQDEGAIYKGKAGRYHCL